jgi:beta-glucosidase-like glycosyl hydrolase
VKERTVAESYIDLFAADVVKFAAKVGSDNDATPERDISKEETPSDLLLAAATEGVVVLNNDGNLLPLSPSSNLQIAVFGCPASKQRERWSLTPEFRTYYLNTVAICTLSSNPN